MKKFISNQSPLLVMITKCDAMMIKNDVILFLYLIHLDCNLAQYFQDHSISPAYKTLCFIQKKPLYPVALQLHTANKKNLPRSRRPHERHKKEPHAGSNKLIMQAFLKGAL